MKLDEVEAAAPDGERHFKPSFRKDRSEGALVIGVVAILVSSAWRWSGLRMADGPWFSVAALVLLLILVLVADARSWSRDAWFWFGLLFLAYLGIQWWNAGRQLTYDAEVQRWFYTAPRHSRLPWAFSRPEAAQMLHWFGPAWVLALVLRSPCLSCQAVEWVLRTACGSAAILALFGTVQFLTGTDRIYWQRPLADGFFASFPYTNHAAAYFLLMAAIAAGLAFRLLFRRQWPAARTGTVGMAVSALLCLTGANLSLSRAGVLLSWVLALFLAAFGLIRGMRWLRPVTRVYLVAVVSAAMISYAILVAGTGGEAIRGEFTPQRRPRHQAVPGLTQVNLDLSDRPILWCTAWKVFRAHPWYGVGGWGFRYLAAFHLPPEQWGYLRNNPGRANVHNDALQFLAEFGLAGTGLMALAWGALLVPLFRPDATCGALFTTTCAGLVLVAAMGLIDLPFRCPAVLWTWTAAFAALPKCTGRRLDHQCRPSPIDANSNSA